MKRILRYCIVKIRGVKKLTYLLMILSINSEVRITHAD